MRALLIRMRSAQHRTVASWQRIEPRVMTNGFLLAVFAAALAVYALESVALPVYQGRDMARYIQAFLQLGYREPVLPSVIDDRGPLAAVGVGAPLTLGGAVATLWLALLYSASIVAWTAAARVFGAAAAALTGAVLLLYPGYSILFHELASDSLFAAGFAGWALLLTKTSLQPSTRLFLLLGAATGGLALIRPGNQVLLSFALWPLLLKAPLLVRLRWGAAYYIAAVAITESWDAILQLLLRDTVSRTPSVVLLISALALLPLFFDPPWRRRMAVATIVLVAGGAIAQGVRMGSPLKSTRDALVVHPWGTFLFRTYTQGLMLPENGDASRALAEVVGRELLTKEPYRSYGVDEGEFLRSGSLRMFEDLVTLEDVDRSAATREAILGQPGAFLGGILDSFLAEVWSLRLYPARAPEPPDPSDSPGGGDGLPVPTEGDLIPGARAAPDIHTLYGGVRVVWGQGEQMLVFDDPRDERRWEAFAADTDRLAGRIPVWDPRHGLVHRLEQASRVFPPPIVWLAIGLLGLAIRRPKQALAALAPSAAGLVVVAATAAVTFSVVQYAIPVVPAFIMLAAVALAAPRRSESPRTSPSAMALP